jgi:transaldolase
MKLFLDSAETDEISEGLALWNIDGVTTNPRHIASSGKPRLVVLREIAELVAGKDKPVSVEIDPRIQQWQDMVDAAQKLASLSPNFVIKVGAGEEGFRAVRELASQGIRTNVTLVFSVAQAWHAARSGADYISPFLGWRETHGDDAFELITDVCRLISTHGYQTEVIAAAIRNSRQIAAAALAGAHCVTASAAVYRDSFRNPYTDMGHALFANAWDSTPPD